MKKPLRIGRAGFTITDFIVSMLISLIFGFAAWSYYRNDLRELTNQSARIEGADRVRAAMTFMAREVRRAGLDAQATALLVPGAKGISDARADRLLIQFDANSSGTIDANAADPSAESVLYSYDAASKQILRTVAGTAQMLISSVGAGGLSFQYYDGAGAVLSPSGSPAQLTASQRDLVAIVKISLQVQATGTTTTTLRLAQRVAVRSRILDKI